MSAVRPMRVGTQMVSVQQHAQQHPVNMRVLRLSTSGGVCQTFARGGLEGPRFLVRFRVLGSVPGSGYREPRTPDQEPRTEPWTRDPGPGTTKPYSIQGAPYCPLAATPR